jgi:excisionase family DNA binding protein
MTGNDTANLKSDQDPLTIGDVISLDVAAEYAGLTRKTLRNYALKGRLRARKLGSQWVTTRAAVDEYLGSRSLENIPRKHRRPS